MKRTVLEFASKLALGTVQLGLNYGVSNQSGKPSETEAHRILEFAFQSGISTLDTARAYGTSESVIGQFLKTHSGSFRLVTKLGDHSRADADFETSLASLGGNKIDALLLHKEDDLLSNEAEGLWKKLSAWQEQGRVGKIGVSCYSPEKLLEILKRYPIEIVQVPCNILDRRFLSRQVVGELKRRKIEMHARSAFLQGLFFLDPENAPPRMGFAAPTLIALRELALSPGDPAKKLAALSLGFCLSQAALDKVVIGVNSQAELAEIMDWGLPTLSDENDAKIAELWRMTEGKILNPAIWPK